MLDKSAFLAKMQFTADLNAHELTELANKFQWMEYEHGVDIIIQGQEQHGFFILAAGEAEIIYYHQGLQTLYGEKFVPGQSFGELDLFSGKPAFATVRSAGNSKVLTLHADDFASMLIRWPTIYEYFITDFTRKIKQINVDLWETKYKEFLRSGLRFNQNQNKFYHLWGGPKTTKLMEAIIAELCQTRAPLLLSGEEGTGHQMLAWYIHKSQNDENAPFLVIDGKQLDHQWSDLVFANHSYPANASTNKGFTLLHLAEQGTLYIRNINLISQRGQQNLAELLQGKHLPCRIIGGLLGEQERLAVPLIPQLQAHFPISYRLSPLRERKKDIPVIINGILEQLAKKHNRLTPVLDRDAMKLLITHHYRQSNVTELIKIVERSFFLAEGQVIGVEHLFFGPTANIIGRALDLLQWPWLRHMVKKGYFPNGLQYIFFTAFITTIATLLFTPNSPAGSIGMVLAWGIWWPFLVISSFTLGRIWCSVCPISLCLELAQKIWHLNRPVPSFIKRYDYLLTTFLFLLIFWVEAVIHMRYSTIYTALWLLLIMLLAAITGVIFTRHAWCRHLCPLGGLVGMASINGILELRAESDVCLNKCTSHECFRGSAQIGGCPMSQYAPFLDSNLSCKLCFRCVRNCQLEAVKFNLRIPAREIWQLVRVHQGYVIFIGVSLSILLPITYFEPLYGIWPESQWKLWFSVFYWGTALLAGLLTWFMVRPFKTRAASTRVKLTFALIPLLLAGYIAYQLHFIPGTKTIMLGISYYTNGAVKHLMRLSVLRTGQFFTALAGLLFTCITIPMVIWRSK